MKNIMKEIIKQNKIYIGFIGFSFICFSILSLSIDFVSLKEIALSEDISCKTMVMLLLSVPSATWIYLICSYLTWGLLTYLNKVMKVYSSSMTMIFFDLISYLMICFVFRMLSFFKKIDILIFGITIVVLTVWIFKMIIIKEEDSDILDVYYFINNSENSFFPNKIKNSKIMFNYKEEIITTNILELKFNKKDNLIYLNKINDGVISARIFPKEIIDGMKFIQDEKNKKSYLFEKILFALMVIFIFIMSFSENAIENDLKEEEYIKTYVYETFLIDGRIVPAKNCEFKNNHKTCEVLESSYNKEANESTIKIVVEDYWKK